MLLFKSLIVYKMVKRKKSEKSPPPLERKQPHLSEKEELFYNQWSLPLISVKREKAVKELKEIESDPFHDKNYTWFEQVLIHKNHPELAELLATSSHVSDPNDTTSDYAWPVAALRPKTNWDRYQEITRRWRTEMESTPEWKHWTKYQGKKYAADASIRKADSLEKEFKRIEIIVTSEKQNVGKKLLIVLDKLLKSYSDKRSKKESNDPRVKAILVNRVIISD